MRLPFRACGLRWSILSFLSDETRIFVVVVIMVWTRREMFATADGLRCRAPRLLRASPCRHCRGTPHVRAAAQRKRAGFGGKNTEAQEAAATAAAAAASERAAAEAAARAAAAAAAQQQQGAPSAQPRARERQPHPLPTAEALPQRVMDRMLSRVVSFAAPPLLIGFVSGPAAYMYKATGHELPASLLYASGSALFVLAGVGISFGVLSTSWDENVEGTRLGWEELKANLPVLRESIPLLRTRK